MLFTVIGLGNPGSIYEKTRHNVGFHVVDRLAQDFKIQFKKIFFQPYLMGSGTFKDHSIILVKPLTYMNRSGQIIPSLFKKKKISHEDILVVCDNLDLPAGQCRLKVKGSSGGQRGLASIIEACGTQDFRRLYVGIGRPDSDSTVVDHVLGIPVSPEKELIEEGVIRAQEAIVRLFEETPDQVMASLNKKVQHEHSQL